MTKYELSVAAAMLETKSKFKLAEALALDIPKQEGKGLPGVTSKLEDVRQAIIVAGGEPRAVKTLATYRDVGLWVSSPVNGEARWVQGYSFTSHVEAMHSGITIDEFTKTPKTVRETREESGGASKDGSPVNVIAGWSDDQKAEAREQLMQDAVAKIVADEPVKLPPVDRGKPKAVRVEEEKAHKQLVYVMAEVMHFSRQTIQRAKTATAAFEEVMPSVWWEKGFPGETRHRSHEEQVLGDIDKAIEALHEMRIEVAKVIDSAKANV